MKLDELMIEFGTSIDELNAVKKMAFAPVYFIDFSDTTSRFVSTSGTLILKVNYNKTISIKLVNNDNDTIFEYVDSRLKSLVEIDSVYLNKEDTKEKIVQYNECISDISKTTGISTYTIHELCRIIQKYSESSNFTKEEQESYNRMLKEHSKNIGINLNEFYQ